jgi:hypothetical protein
MAKHSIKSVRAPLLTIQQYALLRINELNKENYENLIKV